MEDNRPRYKGVCPVCGADLWICMSIAMMGFGINLGHGSCHTCKAFLHLTFNVERQEFDTEPWEDYIDRERYRSILRKLL